MRPKTLVSFFAGLGGFDLAFSRHGFNVVLQVEIEEACRQIEAEKFPNAIQLPDITAINAVYRRLRKSKPIVNYEKWKIIFELLANTDVFCGGWPCQDLSVAGQRAGLSGERSGLWFALRRLIAIFRPPWFVGENVPGLLSSHEGRDAATVFCGLANLGYWWAYRIYDAQYFGLAQRRERVFVVAGLEPRSVAEILFEPESLCWDTPPGRETGQRVAPAVEGRAGRSGANNFATMTANPIGGHHPRSDLDHETYVCSSVAGTLNSSGAGTARTGNERQEADFYVVDETAKCRGTSQGGVDREDKHTLVCMAHGQANAEIRSDGSPSLTCNHEAPIVAAKGNYSNPQSGQPCHPLAESAHAPATKSIVRRLTPTECEKLQGLPVGWTEGFADTVRYRMIGNAVAIPCVEFIARRLSKTIDKQRGVS